MKIKLNVFCVITAFSNDLSLFFTSFVFCFFCHFVMLTLGFFFSVSLTSSRWIKTRLALSAWQIHLLPEHSCKSITDDRKEYKAGSYLHAIFNLQNKKELKTKQQITISQWSQGESLLSAHLCHSLWHNYTFAVILILFSTPTVILICLLCWNVGWFNFPFPA